MKRTIAVILLFLLLLSACSKPESAKVIGTSATERTTVTEAGIVSETREETAMPGTDAPEEAWTDPEDYVPPTSDNPMAICNLFPDPYFARTVAWALDREAADVVSYEELASYRGEIHCSPGPLKSIEGIGLLKNITAFDSAKNDLAVIPAEFGKLTELKSINLLKSYSLKKLPEEIGNLKKLTFLRVDMTNLEALPAGIGGCESLQILNAANTPIQSVPAEIGRLKNLLFLDLHSTGIQKIPDSICQLTKLQSLDLGDTKLKALPQNIGRLSALLRLDLFGCQLKTLPSGLKNLKQLRYLNVFDNFSLNEDYMQWFDEKIWGCKDDPAEEERWSSFYHYNG